MTAAEGPATAWQRTTGHFGGWTRHEVRNMLTVLIGRCCWLPPVVARKSSSGKIVGAVQDDSGGVHARRHHRRPKSGTGITRETVTNERGQYEVPGASAGPVSGRGRARGVPALLAAVRSPSRSTRRRASTWRSKLGDARGDDHRRRRRARRPDHDVRRSARSSKRSRSRAAAERPQLRRTWGCSRPGVTTRGQSTTRCRVRGARAAQDSNNFQLDGVANVSLGGNTRAGPPERRRRPGVQDPDEQLLGRIRPQLRVGRAGGDQVGHAINFSGKRLGVPSQRQVPVARTTSPPPIRRLSSRTSTAARSAGRSHSRPLLRAQPLVLLRVVRRLPSDPRPDATDRRGDRSASGTAISASSTAPILDPLTGQPFPGNRIPVRSDQPGGTAVCSTLMPLPNIAGTAAAPEQLRLVARRRSRTSTSTCCGSTTRSTRSGTCSIATSSRTTTASTHSRARARRAIWASRRERVAHAARDVRR